jgi:hypothetical protein
VPSELQSGGSGRVGHRRDAAVVEEATPVVDDLGDAGGLAPLGDEATDAGGRLDVAGAARARRSGSSVDA